MHVNSINGFVNRLQRAELVNRTQRTTTGNGQANHRPASFGSRSGSGRQFEHVSIPL